MGSCTRVCVLGGVPEPQPSFQHWGSEGPWGGLALLGKPLVCPLRWGRHLEIFCSWGPHIESHLETQLSSNLASVTLGKAPHLRVSHLPDSGISSTWRVTWGACAQGWSCLAPSQLIPFVSGHCLPRTVTASVLGRAVGAPARLESHCQLNSETGAAIVC